jgi:hypothetical protein
MWLMIRKIYLKFEVDTLRNEKVKVKNILLHQNFNLKSGRGSQSRGEYDSSPNTSYSRAKKGTNNTTSQTSQLFILYILMKWFLRSVSKK